MTTTRSPRPRRPRHSRHACRPLAALLAGALALLTGMAAAPAGAATTPAPQTEDLSWSVRPADDPGRPSRTSYAYQVDPGAVVQDGMVIENLGSEPVDLVVYAADGVTTAGGYLDLEPADITPSDVGAWVQVDGPEITLDPGERTQVDFTITVPDDATPGDHPGGIVASLSSAAQGEDGPVRLDRRLGARLNLRVSGETSTGLLLEDVRLDRSADSWNPLTAAPTTVSYRVTNTGNVRTVGYADVAVAGPLDLGAARTLETVPELLPGASVERTVALPDTHAWGRLQADITLTAEPVDGPPAEASTATASIWALPWGAVALLAGVVLLVVLLVILRRRRTRRRASAAADATSEVPRSADTGVSAR